MENRKTGCDNNSGDRELIPGLFKTEYAKIVAVLCRRFGFAEMETAEDIAADTFMAAMQTWPLQGIPPNPAAWLYSVAKNKAKNYLRRDELFAGKVSPVLQYAAADTTDQAEIDLSPQHIRDSQLQMMFAICNPTIPPEAQIGLALRILCGFGIEEVATAFLSNKETINKRLFRAKEKLREQNISIAFPPQHELNNRLDNVLTTIYLLFSEGYYSESHQQPLRKELCFEAMRLGLMLTEHPDTAQPRVYALLALMHFHASRFAARTGSNGELVLYQDQDESLWDPNLIARGAIYLKQASTGEELSRYHLEAAIAWWHTQKADTPEKWENILQLYNHLLQIQYSPVAALNRTYALAKANGKEQAIVEAHKLNLATNPFYFALLGELYTGIDNKTARQYFEAAKELTRSIADRQAMQQKMDALK